MTLLLLWRTTLTLNERVTTYWGLAAQNPALPPESIFFSTQLDGWSYPSRASSKFARKRNHQDKYHLIMTISITVIGHILLSSSLNQPSQLNKIRSTSQHIPAFGFVPRDSCPTVNPSINQSSRSSAQSRVIYTYKCHYNACDMCTVHLTIVIHIEFLKLLS